MPAQAKTAHKARKRRKIGTLKQCKARLWQAIESATAIIENERQPEVVLRGVHALSQAIAAYVRLSDAHTAEPVNTAIAEQLTKNLT